MGLPREAFFSLQIVTDQGVEVTDQGGRFSGGDVMPWHRWQLLADQGVSWMTGWQQPIWPEFILSRFGCHDRDGDIAGYLMSGW